MPFGPSNYADQPDLVRDEDFVYRRIPPDALNWSSLSAQGQPKINKNAFSDLPEEQARILGCPGRAMSVSIHSILMSHRLDPAVYLLSAQWQAYGLVRIRVRDLRAAGSQGLQPWPTDEDISHAVVFTTTAGAMKRNKGDERRTREAAEWVVVPSHIGN